MVIKGLLFVGKVSIFYALLSGAVCRNRLLDPLLLSLFLVSFLFLRGELDLLHISH